MTKPDLRKELSVSGRLALREAIKQLDKTGHGVLFIVDKDSKMKGILTDADLRKLMLNRVNLSTPIAQVMNKAFSSGSISWTHEACLNFLRKIKRRHLPILDKKGKLKDVVLLEDVSSESNNTLVVIMAGGLGTRLAPLTHSCPKPMFKIGDKPVLEIILDNFIYHGFRRFLFSVNYKAEMVMDYFGQGERYGVEIQYLRESQPLGTAGALANFEELPKLPFIVINGDLLTKVDFKSLLDFHIAQNAIATMGVRQFSMEVPYGVVKIENSSIVSHEEKPISTFYVNAGIYVFDPLILSYFAKGVAIDMPSVFQALIQDRKRTAAFLIHEYWLDIGKTEDFQRANSEYGGIFE